MKQKSTHMRVPIWVAERIRAHATENRRTDPAQIEHMLVVYEQVVKRYHHDAVKVIAEDLGTYTVTPQKHDSRPPKSTA